MEINKIYEGDCLEVLKTFPDNCFDCCITSPPYFGLRDYQMGAQIGLEETPELYVLKMVEVFTEVKRVLKKEGTLWINLGDSYAGGAGRWGGKDNLTGFQAANQGSLTQIDVAKKWKHDTIKPKDLIGIPWMIAFALRSIGYYLRQDIIWSKPNPMPESVTDRCTKSHEYIFLLSKSGKYYYDAESIKSKAIEEWGSRLERESKKSFPDQLKNGIRSGVTLDSNDNANKRSVWTVTTRPYSDAHFATFPERLITDMIKAGCPESGIILDPFMGAGTTGLVARKLHRNFIGIELNPAYIKIANKRLNKELGMFI